MDIESEINRLPNYYYAINKDDGRRCEVSLGGSACKIAAQFSFPSKLCYIHEKILSAFEKGEDNLTDVEKSSLADYFSEFGTFCDERSEELYSRSNQSDFLKSLSETERQQIEQQIRIYKACRRFYRESGFDRR